MSKNSTWYDLCRCCFGSNDDQASSAPLIDNSDTAAAIGASQPNSYGTSSSSVSPYQPIQATPGTQAASSLSDFLATARTGANGGDWDTMGTTPQAEQDYDGLVPFSPYSQQQQQQEQQQEQQQQPPSSTSAATLVPM